MKKYLKGLFGAISVALLAFTGAQAQLQPVLIDNVSGQIVQANAGSSTSTRQGAKPASMDTYVSGGGITAEIIPCAIHTPAAGEVYFAERAEIIQKLLADEFPTKYAVSRLKAEYTHSANTTEGMQVVGAMTITAAPGTTISLDKFRIWCYLAGVPSEISNDYGTLGYKDYRPGIIFGPNGTRTYVTDAEGSVQVHKIVFIGLGQSLNNTVEQVRAAYAAGPNTFKAKWFAQIKLPDTEFTVPPGDFVNISFELGQQEQAPPPVIDIVTRSVKNPGKFPWFVLDSPTVDGNYAPLGDLPPGGTFPTPLKTTFLRFRRP